MFESKKLTISNNQLFYIMIFLIAIHQCLSDVSSLFYFYMHIRPIVMGGIVLLAVLQFLKGNHVLPRKQYYILFFLFTSFFTSYRIGNAWLIYFFVIAFYLRGKDLNKIIQIITVVATVVFIINLLIFAVNLLAGNVADLKYYVRANDTILRWYIYYNSPNGAPRNLIFICLGWLYIKRDRLKIRHYFIMIATCALVFYFTRSDALLIIPLSIVLYSTLPKIKKGMHILDIIRSAVFVGGFCISILYIVLYICGLSDWMKPINLLLTGRLSLASLSFIHNGITILGQEVLLGYQSIGNTARLIYCDNAYIYCMICYGLLYLLFFMYVLGKIFKSRMTIKDNTALIVYGLYMIIENRFIDIPTSIPLIIIFFEYMNSVYSD